MEMKTVFQIPENLLEAAGRKRGNGGQALEKALGTTRLPVAFVFSSEKGNEIQSSDKRGKWTE